MPRLGNNNKLLTGTSECLSKSPKPQPQSIPTKIKISPNKVDFHGENASKISQSFSEVMQETVKSGSCSILWNYATEKLEDKINNLTNKITQNHISKFADQGIYIDINIFRQLADEAIKLAKDCGRAWEIESGVPLLEFGGDSYDWYEPLSSLQN